MNDIGEGAKLALEAIQVAPGCLAQQLQRHFALQLAIVGAVHRAGSTGAERAAHLEPAGSERRSRGGRHRSSDDITQSPAAAAAPTCAERGTSYFEGRRLLLPAARAARERREPWRRAWAIARARRGRGAARRPRDRPRRAAPMTGRDRTGVARVRAGDPG